LAKILKKILFVVQILRAIKIRLVFITMRVLGIILGLLPRRVAFALIVVLTAVYLPGTKLLAKSFYPAVVKSLYRKPDCRFSSAVSRFFPSSEIRVLRLAGAYEELCERSLDTGIHMNTPKAAYDLTLALFELGEFERAREVMNAFFAPSQLAHDAAAAHFSALLNLIAKDIPGAATNLSTASIILPDVMRPHQNMAARYVSPYKPTSTDVAAGKWGRIYSAANYLGQRVTHVGQGQIGPRMYELAFEAQRHLANNPPRPSPALEAMLADLDIAFEDLKLLPEEWVTQIGHLGMLDMLFRMRELGWWSGKAVILGRNKLIANHAMLRLYGKESAFVTLGPEIGLLLSEELVSLEFWKAMTFNAFTLPSGEVVPWQDAGAKMMQIWESEGRGYPVRDEFDRQLGSSEPLLETARRMKKRIGMPEDAWYVCLHVRDASHYGELPGTGQTHRNADITNYLKAVQYITGRGGWVIKLGGRKSPKLPEMPGVFDYTRSQYRSNIMDMLLIRNARMFIGTTSGLTNVAVSFGIPCALVNCITTDAQLWGDKVRFALKWIKMRDGSLIDQMGVSTAPWRWRVFNAELTARSGAALEENSADEILETVKEVESLAIGDWEGYASTFPQAQETLDRWRASLPMPYYYGNAQPSLYCAAKYPSYLRASGPE
jgi:putative glycosyltransferase (TIGR04372 family)